MIHGILEIWAIALLVGHVLVMGFAIWIMQYVGMVFRRSIIWFLLAAITILVGRCFNVATMLSGRESDPFLPYWTRHLLIPTIVTGFMCTMVVSHYRGILRLHGGAPKLLDDLRRAHRDMFTLTPGQVAEKELLDKATTKLWGERGEIDGKA